jgi:hypothetical protein
MIPRRFAERPALSDLLGPCLSAAHENTGHNDTVVVASLPRLGYRRSGSQNPRAAPVLLTLAVCDNHNLLTLLEYGRHDLVHGIIQNIGRIRVGHVQIEQARGVDARRHVVVIVDDQGLPAAFLSEAPDCADRRGAALPAASSAESLGRVPPPPGPPGAAEPASWPTARSCRRWGRAGAPSGSITRLEPAAVDGASRCRYHGRTGRTQGEGVAGPRPVAIEGACARKRTVWRAAGLPHLLRCGRPRTSSHGAYAKRCPPAPATPLRREQEGSRE